MSPTTASHRSDDPRRRILDAATEVFAERGFEGAGVDEIAHRAGVNKAMLYYHVGDKAALYGAVALEYLDAVRRAVEEGLAAARDPRQGIRAIQRGFLRVSGDHPHYSQLILREVAAGGVHLPDQALAIMAGLMRLTRSVVDEGRRSGAFRDVHPLLTHLVVVGSALFIINAQRVRQRLEEAGLTPEGVPADLLGAADQLSDIILNGIVTRRGHGGKR